MRSIAARPDYGRLGFSRDFANGAPVVAGGTIQPAQMGRQDVATASDGRRIPVQYAVVDAGSVLTSNTVDGTSNPSYGDSNIPAVRAIAGNGRIAGLQSAYQSGNANAYRQELVQDAALHGIDPEVIAPMAQPVLVRVMPAEAVTADIGDISNTVGNLDLSAVEQANNDANRVQLEALQFADDGSITTDAVRQFVRAMPQSEQGQLLDTNGQPTRQAVDRLSAAVFAKAYGNEALTRLYSQAQDPEARLVMSALAQVAPKMARLEGAGALDIRDVVAQAAEIAVNARRQGVPLARAAQQLDIAADPAVGVVLDLFAANSRSVRPVVEALARAADAAYTEATKPAEDMFGTVPRASRADIINQLRPENERRSQEALEDAAGREPAAVDAVRQANEPAGSAAPAAVEAGRSSEDAATEGLTSYTAEEVAQRQDAAAQAESATQRAESAAARAESAARQAKEIAQRSVAASDSFELGQSGEDNLSGQGGLAFSFAGARAATADTMSLVTAQDRLAAGEDAETVRRETGWHRGVDGRMRFEISDNEAKVDMALLANLHRGGFVERDIEHVSYRQEPDGTYSLTLAPKSPQKTSDFISMRGISANLLPSLLPQGALDAIDQNQGEADMIGPNLDDARRVRAPFQFMGFNALPLGVVMDHPKLFAAYPVLREIMVRVDPRLGSGATFAVTDYVDGTVGNVIKIGNPLAKDVDSVLLHEIQHGIQDIEGFATGGSPTNAAGYEVQVNSELVDLLQTDKQMDKAYQKWAAYQRDMEEGREFSAADAENAEAELSAMPDGMRVIDLHSTLDGLADPASAPIVMRDRYRRLAGEVEARNTQARKNISDIGRKLIPPGKTADVADSDVIVVFNGKEMASAPTPANAAGAKATTPIRDYGANYEALAGKDVTYTVPTTEGGTASVTVDAQSVLTQYDQRMQALETLRKCL